MRFYLRAMSYFKQDLLLIGSIMLLIGLSVCVGLLQAWPLGIMADMLTKQDANDWIHRVFNAMLLPFSRGGMPMKIIGLTLIGMFLKIAQDSIALAKNMLNNYLRYNGNSRARSELFQRLQALGPDYHRNKPQGDAIWSATMSGACSASWTVSSPRALH